MRTSGFVSFWIYMTCTQPAGSCSTFVFRERSCTTWLLLGLNRLLCLLGPSLKTARGLLMDISDITVSRSSVLHPRNTGHFIQSNLLMQKCTVRSRGASIQYSFLSFSSEVLTLVLNWSPDISIHISSTKACLRFPSGACLLQACLQQSSQNPLCPCFLFSSSVPEVPDAGEEEGHPILVAAVHGVLVPDAATRLRDHCDAALARLLHCVVPRCTTHWFSNIYHRGFSFWDHIYHRGWRKYM